jgi:hypothetical protein
MARNSWGAKAANTNLSHLERTGTGESSGAFSGGSAERRRLAVPGVRARPLQTDINDDSIAALSHAWRFIDELPCGLSLIPLEDILGPHERQRNDRIVKTCQHSAMKHPKHSKHAPPTHPSALAVPSPSYHRILVKHGLIEKTLSIPDAYKVFLKVGADPEVQNLRRKVEHGNKMKHVPALYLATAMALQGMTKQELEALKLRIEETVRKANR